MARRKAKKSSNRGYCTTSTKTKTISEKQKETKLLLREVEMRRSVNLAKKKVAFSLGAIYRAKQELIRLRKRLAAKAAAKQGIVFKRCQMIRRDKSARLIQRSFRAYATQKPAVYSTSLTPVASFVPIVSDIIENVAETEAAQSKTNSQTKTNSGKHKFVGTKLDIAAFQQKFKIAPKQENKKGHCKRKKSNASITSTASTEARKRPPKKKQKPFKKKYFGPKHHNKPYHGHHGNQMLGYPSYYHAYILDHQGVPMFIDSHGLLWYDIRAYEYLVDCINMQMMAQPYQNLDSNQFFF